MKDLFNGRFAPITRTLGFLHCNHSLAAQAFLDWQEGIQKTRNVSLIQKIIRGDLEFIIKQLLPLTSVERRRFLFIPTRHNWTAFLDNGHQGTDVFSTLSYLAGKLSCEAVRSTYIPEGRSNEYAAVIFEIYGPDRTDFLNYIRSVSIAYDGRKWSFVAAGRVQPFEKTEQYTSRLERDRFTPEMLANYLKALGINAFEKDFYLSDGQNAILVEKVGPIAPAAREFELDQFVN